MRKLHLSQISFVVVILAYIISPFFFNDQRSNLIFLIVGVTILSQLKLSHKEKEFLIRLFDKQFCYSYKTLESLIVISPIILSFLFHQKWLFTSILLVFSAIIHFVNSKSKTNLLYKFTLFHPKQFEWNSGIRKFFIAFIVFIPLFIYSLFYIPNDVIPFLLVYAIMLLPALFHSTQEEISFVKLYRSKPDNFLLKKIGYNSVRLLILGAPLVALTWSLKQNINWIIPTAIFIQSFVFLFISILHKYAFWEESGRFELLNSVLFFSSILPFLLPFNLLYLLYIRKRAIKNLEHIL